MPKAEEGQDLSHCKKIDFRFKPGRYRRQPPALQLRMLFDVADKGADVGRKGRAGDVVRCEQRARARGVVGLLKEKVGNGDARQPGYFLGEGQRE